MPRSRSDPGKVRCVPVRLGLGCEPETWRCGVAIRHRLIKASPQTVWGILADGTRYAEWVVGTSASKPVRGQWPQVDSAISYEVRLGPVRLTNETVVRHLHRGQRAEFGGTGRCARNSTDRNRAPSLGKALSGHRERAPTPRGERKASQRRSGSADPTAASRDAGPARRGLRGADPRRTAREFEAVGAGMARRPAFV